MSLTSFLSVSTKIDWDDDGDFADANEDVSADVVYPITTSRGRSSATDEVAAGTGSFTLKDTDLSGKYSPFNTASPLYPNVLPSRPVQVQVTYNAVTYPFFRGRCSPAASQWALHREIPWSMADAFEEWRLGLTNTSILQAKRTDEIITAILDDIGWAAGARSLEAGIRTLSVFTNHNRLTGNALQLAATQELGGLFFVDAAGNAVFQNCYHRAAEPVYLVIDGNTDELQPSLRFDDLVDSVRATYPRFVEGSAAESVFALSVRKRLEPGTGTFEFEINASGVLGARNYVTPLVATTDFTANAQQDGAGADKTAQVTVSVSASDSGGGTLSWVNNDSAPVYLLIVQVLALATKAGEEVNAIRKTVAGPIVTGQQLNKDFAFNADAAAVEAWTQWQAAVRGIMNPRITVTVQPTDDVMMAAVLGADLGKRVTVVDTAAPWQTQISGAYFIEGISMSIEGPASIEATWSLLSADLVGGSMFRISGAAGGGADYSTIAAATGSGFDRIAF